MSSSRGHFDPHAFCALPLVQRFYHALMVAVALFIVALVALREPFRGYLGEVRIAGPATEGLDLDAAVAWLKQVDRQVAAVATPAGEISAKSQIRVTRVASRPPVAVKRLDELAERWLYQYLPDRLQAYRREALVESRAAVQAARDREDAAHQRLESLRQQQLALLLKTPAEPSSTPPPAQLPLAPLPTEGRAKLVEKLESLKLELSRLLGTLTNDHPQVVAVRTQIASIESELGSPSFEPMDVAAPLLAPPASPSGEQRAAAKPLERPFPGPQFVSAAVATTQSATTAADEATLAAATKAAMNELSQCSSDRQKAEQRLSERMQEISVQPTASQWSAARAYVVTRLGGTPRSSTLALAGLLALVGGAAMFRAAQFTTCPTRISTTERLASALELSVVGDLSPLRATAAQIRRRLYTPGRVKAVLLLAELVVATAVFSCLGAMLMEPSLAQQVLADPFGTLSEVLGRFQ